MSKLSLGRSDRELVIFEVLNLNFELREGDFEMDNINSLVPLSILLILMGQSQTLGASGIRTDSSATVEEVSQTAEDQMSSNSFEDEVTRKIRLALMEESSLSIAAKNTKIVTAGNKVTLLGELTSAAELARVYQIAQEATDLPVLNNIKLKTE